MVLRLLIVAVLLNVSATCAQSFSQAGKQSKDHQHQNPQLHLSDQLEGWQVIMEGCDSTFFEFSESDIWGSSKRTIPWSKYSINILKKPNFALHQPRSGGTSLMHLNNNSVSSDFAYPVIRMTGFLFAA